MRLVTLYLFISIMVISCTEDDPIEMPDHISTQSIIITNEGSFSSPTASISQYNSVTKTVANNLYQSFNNQPLGTILQDLAQSNSSYYAVMNVTGEIVQFDNVNCAEINRISGLESPRYILVDGEMAYVTDLSRDVVYIISLSDNSVSEIPLTGWTEDIILNNDLLVIGGRLTNKVFILDPVSGTFTDTLTVGFGPTDICEDRDGNLWVYCAGESFYTPMIPASIYRVNVASRSSEKIHEFTDLVAGASSRLELNPGLDTVYFSKENIFRFSIDNPSLTDEFFIRDGSNWYGLGIANNSTVYAADAVDFAQNGLVYHLSSTGVVIDSFRVGVNPNGFLFL